MPATAGCLTAIKDHLSESMMNRRLGVDREPVSGLFRKFNAVTTFMQQDYNIP
jgi:hypothetical protein